MAFMANPRNHQRDTRGGGSTLPGGGGYPSSAHPHQRDHSHHDYTNISTGRISEPSSPFAPISGGDINQELRNRPHLGVKNGDGPFSPNVRGEAPIFHSREGSRVDSGQGRGDSGFRRIREHHARPAGPVFQDKDFPPNITSIYYSREPLHRTSSIQWARPEAICAPQKPAFVLAGFNRFDVEQGELGDCWFVAAMACLCDPDHHRLVERVIPPNQSFQDGYTGQFRFNFWHFGEWREVVVDDLLPISAIDRSLKFVHSTQRNEFWPALMEKAYAKLYGSYEALKGGHMKDSLTDLTGGITESYTLRGEKSNYPRNIVTILFKALERGALIGCGIDGDGRESKLPSGLIASHAYSVTDLKAVPLQSGEVVLIRIRNPHGTNEWKGHWSDRSSKWQQVHSEERARLGLTRRDDGEFWMDFRDFLGNFDTLDICNLSPDTPSSAPRRWFTAHHHGRWVKHFNAGGRPKSTDSHWTNPQYVMKLDDTDDDDDLVCSVIIQLMQKDRRKMKHKGEVFRFIGFVIYEVPPGYSVPLNRDFFERHRAVEGSDTFSNSRQIVKRCTLPRGTYVVVPSTWDKDEEADFYMRFFFEKGNVSEYADEPPEKVEVPPPEPSPKYREQEDQLKKFFYEKSGEDMEISCFELQEAVNEALKKEPLHREIGLDACRSFVSLMDVDNSGRLGYTEFQYLWKVLRSWKKTFLHHDANNSGKMNSRELRTALASVGYKVSNGMLAAAIFRYADPSGSISLDNFLILMAKLMKLFNVHHKHQKDGKAAFTLQQWVEESLRL